MLKEIDQLQSQSSARTGSAGAVSHREGMASSASLDSLPRARKKRYPRVTLAAFRPRSSSNAVHCELPQVPSKPKPDKRHVEPPTRRPNEIVFTSASFVTRSPGVASYALQVSTAADARVTLVDLRDDARASNQELKTTRRQSSMPMTKGYHDPVLTHHLQLAHVWTHTSHKQ